MLEVGKPAPSFVLPDQDGAHVSTESLRGRRVVLYFYPKDDTPGCTVEACEFTHGLAQFAGLNAVVYGCSADDAESHRRFIAKHGLKVGLLTDADHAVMTAYGAWGEKVLYGKTVQGVIRSTVLIDENGVVAAHWPKVKAEGHAAEVAAALAALANGAAPAPASAATSEATPAAAVAPASRRKPAAARAARKTAPAPKRATAAKKSAPAKAKAPAKKAARKAAGKPARKGAAAKKTKTAKAPKAATAKAARPAKSKKTVPAAKKSAGAKRGVARPRAAKATRKAVRRAAPQSSRRARR